MMLIIEVAFIRFYISLFFIKKLTVSDGHPTTFALSPSVCMAETQIVPSNKIRGYVPRLYTIRHVGRVAISEGLGSNGKQAMHAWLCWDGYAGCAVHTKGKQDTLLQYYSITVCIILCSNSTDWCLVSSQL